MANIFTTKISVSLNFCKHSTENNKGPCNTSYTVGALRMAWIFYIFHKDRGKDFECSHYKEKTNIQEDRYI